MVVRLQGTATEVIKNIVLAGIGKLVMVDDADVAEEDLGSGFFFREQDVGLKVRRVHSWTRIFDGYSSVLARDGRQGSSGEPQPSRDGGSG